MSLFRLLYNSEEQRIRGLLRLVLVSSVVFVVYWVAAYMCQSIPNDYIYYLCNETLTCILSVLVFVVAFSFLDKRRFSQLGLFLNRKWFNSLFNGSLVGFFIITVNYTVLYILGYIKIEDLFYSTGTFSFLVEILGRSVGFFAVAITEELFVRGYLLINIAEALKSKKISINTSIIIGMAVTSILFGVLHYFNTNATIVSSLNLMLIGFLFGYAFVSTGSLALPIGLHFAWNFTQAQVFGLNVSGFPPLVSIFKSSLLGEPNITGGSFGPEGGIMIIISVFIGLFLVNLFSNGQNSKKISKFVNINTSIAQY